MRLILIRHGQTPWNTERRVQGSTDIPLNDMGRLQAEAAAERLKDVRFDAVYTSPLERARETASILARARGLALQEDCDLAEIRFGKWEGKTERELSELFPELFSDWSWIERPDACAAMGSESQQQVVARALRFLEKLKARHSENARILVVSHSMPVKLIVAHYIGMPYNRIRSLRIENCAYNELDTGKDAIGYLYALNDTSHLGGLL